jgi:hypothetical protein
VLVLVVCPRVFGENSEWSTSPTIGDELTSYCELFEDFVMSDERLAAKIIPVFSF